MKEKEISSWYYRKAKEVIAKYKKQQYEKKMKIYVVKIIKSKDDAYWYSEQNDNAINKTFFVKKTEYSVYDWVVVDKKGNPDKLGRCILRRDTKIIKELGK